MSDFFSAEKSLFEGFGLAASAGSSERSTSTSTKRARPDATPSKDASVGASDANERLERDAKRPRTESLCGGGVTIVVWHLSLFVLSQPRALSLAVVDCSLAPHRCHRGHGQRH